MTTISFRASLFAAVASLALFACASQKPTTAEPAPSEAEGPTFADDAQGGSVPITAKWSLPKVVDGQTHIAARIRHLMEVPVEVQIVVPEGVEVVSGRTRFTIPADGPKVVIESLVLKGALADDAELVVLADAAGVDFGIHGKDVFRTKPKVELRPNESGPEIKVGNKSLGKAVPMKVEGQ